MMLIYSENDGIAFELLSQARRFQAERGGAVVAALLDGNDPIRASHYFAYGAEKVYVASHPALLDLRPEPVVAALAQIVATAGADTVFVDSTRRGKERAGRLAQKLGAACVTDATGVRWIDGGWQVDRAGLGGNTVVTERISTPRAVIAVMPRTFEPGAREELSGQVIEVPIRVEPPTVRVVERLPKSTEGANLEDAEVIVCAGRGVVKREDLALVQELAAALRGEMGCTRSLATDYHWLSEERVIGLSGKRVKPHLYLGVGVSGQIQHTVGVTGAKVIAAINTDKDSPIFQMTDYGIVGDLYEVVPKLTKRLKSQATPRTV
jgi:electron transfer flavoprotein alpha subunit